MFTSRPAMTAVEPATTTMMATSRAIFGRCDVGVLPSVLGFWSVMSYLVEWFQNSAAVPDRAVAVHARDSVGVGGTARHDVVHEAAMAAETRLLQNARIVRLDHDGLVEVLKREALGMVVAVHGLGHQLGHQRMRQVAFHKAGHDVVD